MFGESPNDQSSSGWWTPGSRSTSHSERPFNILRPCLTSTIGCGFFRDKQAWFILGLFLSNICVQSCSIPKPGESFVCCPLASWTAQIQVIFTHHPITIPGFLDYGKTSEPLFFCFVQCFSGFFSHFFPYCFCFCFLLLLLHLLLLLLFASAFAFAFPSTFAF